VPKFEQCDLRDVIDKNIQFLMPEFQKKQIDVKKIFPQEPARIMADREQLYRAFMNIFMNSIQALENKGQITVNIIPGRDNYTVVIEDNGPGIKREHMERIFNPFFTTKDKGSGLGLSIVKKIVEGHNGSITIESPERHGTRVIINLPVRI
jgi:signal transduction histidine kinase